MGKMFTVRGMLLPAPGVRHPDRPRPHLVTVGQAAGRGAIMLTLTCSQCDHSGRMRVARMLAEWGQFAPLADIMDELRADCLHWQNPTSDPHNLCGAHWPDLSALFTP